MTLTPDLIQAIGSLGALCILIGFILNQIGKWKPRQFSYDMVNFVGSALLIWYAFLLHSTPFMILNGVWALVSLRDVIRDMRKK